MTKARATKIPARDAVSVAAVAVRMDAVEDKLARLLTILERGDGHTQQRTATPTSVHDPVRTERAQQIEDIFGDQVPVSRSTRRQLSREPRRQRKQRDMQPRSLYFALPIDTPEKLHVAQDLVPAAAAILLYLGVHPKSTVPDIVASLDLRRRTVENRLSELRKRGLVRSESR